MSLESDGDKVTSNHSNDKGTNPDGSNNTKIEDNDILDIGLTRLSAVFEAEGIVGGDIHLIISEPKIRSEIILHKLAFNRYTFYYSVGKRTESIEKMWTDLGRHSNRIYTREYQDDPLQQIRVDMNKQYNETDLENPNVIINPINELEQGELKELKNLLQEAKQMAEDRNGMVLIHAIDGEHTPEHRWYTKYFSDNIYKITSKRAEQNLQEELVLYKLSERQALDENERIFRLDRGDETDISSSRSVSP
jgi:hypothetical protein